MASLCVKTQTRFGISAAALCLLCCVSGCVVFSCHSIRDVAITVSEANSGRSAARLPIRVFYVKEHPLGLLIAGVPDDVEARTDENGRAVIKLADYGFGIILYAGTNRFVLRKKEVRDGGIVDEISKTPRSPRFRLKLEPTGRRTALRPSQQPPNL